MREKEGEGEGGKFGKGRERERESGGGFSLVVGWVACGWWVGKVGDGRKVGR